MHAFFSEGAGGGVEITDKDAEEDILHIITQCSGYSEIREKKLDELNTLCQGANQICIHNMNKSELCQFLLDPTILNLRSRINPMDPILNKKYVQLHQ